MKFHFLVLVGIMLCVALPSHAAYAAEKQIEVPILMYHHIKVLQHQNPYNVSPKIFDQQMAWLQGHGYHSISLSDFLAALNQQRPLPAKPVVITFDDGHRDQFVNAFPILEKYHMQALFYIVPGYVGKSFAVTWDMLIRMHQAGMDIGSHTMTHADLKHLSVAQVTNQVTQSKRILEQKLGVPILHFAYPGVDFTQTTEKIVRAAGYTDAVATRHGAFHPLNEDRYALRRVHIDDDMQSFVGFVEGTRLN